MKELQLTDQTREQRLNATFVKLADTLVEDYDVVALLHELVTQCVALLDTDAGGLLLADSDGQLQVLTSTSEEAGLVELMQMNAGTGPCIECFETGRPVAVPDLQDATDKWPDFCRTALEHGFRSVYATPMRLRGRSIGAMNLFSSRVGVLSDDDIATARALTDVATIGILQERLIREASLVTEQLQYALESRILIEQAKGVISEANSVDLDEAFELLRGYARKNRLTIRSVAEGLTNRTLRPSVLLPTPR